MSKEIFEKLKTKEGRESLTEEEIGGLLFSEEEIYEDADECGRWVQYMSTVVEIENKQYVIEWGRGLTDSVENEFYSIKPCRLEEKQITVTEIVVLDEE